MIKIGDKVEVTGRGLGITASHMIGEQGTVKKVCSNGSIYVYMDNMECDRVLL